MFLDALKVLVLPPLCLFLLGAAGLCVVRRRPKLGRWLMASSAGLLFLACLPIVAVALLRSLQSTEPLRPGSQDPGASAILVLGADQNSFAPEYGGAGVGPMTLERLRYAAHLARETGLPILVSAGVVVRGQPALAELMKRALERDFQLDVRWVEDRSSDTRSNASRSAEILRSAGILRVYLVTHAFHMLRAQAACEAAGLQVLPAPTGFRAWPGWELGAFLPSARALRETNWALHEWIGRAWYAIH
jgi:uncharacterized SAM-binding protein YcdF (DUF218 family)